MFFRRNPSIRKRPNPFKSPMERDILFRKNGMLTSLPAGGFSAAVVPPDIPGNSAAGCQRHPFGSKNGKGRYNSAAPQGSDPHGAEPVFRDSGPSASNSHWWA